MLFRTPFFLPVIFPNLTWRIPTREKEIYLTFDDGPVPGPTEFVLQELAKRKIPATFFCIGDNIRKHPDIFRRIMEHGHAIGNHTFHHVKGWSSSVDDYVANVGQCQNEFSAKGAKFNSTPLFRPPYGRIKRAQVRALSDYRIVMWDVLTYDYSKSLAAEKCLQGSIGATRPGSIVVFHDSLKAERNLTFVLPRFLDHFAGLGYSFKAISNS